MKGKQAPQFFIENNVEERSELCIKDENFLADCKGSTSTMTNQESTISIGLKDNKNCFEKSCSGVCDSLITNIQFNNIEDNQENSETFSGVVCANENSNIEDTGQVEKNCTSETEIVKDKANHEEMILNKESELSDRAESFEFQSVIVKGNSNQSCGVKEHLQTDKSKITLNGLEEIAPDHMKKSYESMRDLYLELLKNMENKNIWDDRDVDYEFHRVNIALAVSENSLLPYSIVFQQLKIYGGECFGLKNGLSLARDIGKSNLPECVCRHIKEQLELIKINARSSYVMHEYSDKNIVNEAEALKTLEQSPATSDNSKTEVKKSFMVPEPFETQDKLKDENTKITSVMICQNGVKYDGQILNNCLEGKGIYFFPDGSVYEGNWSKNKMHGFGKLMVPEGHIYEGEFSSNKPHGKGIFTERKGNKFIGSWIDGRLNGKVICITATKIIQTGLWCNGRFLNWTDGTNLKNTSCYQGDTNFGEISPSLYGYKSNNDLDESQCDSIEYGELSPASFKNCLKLTDVTCAKNKGDKCSKNKIGSSPRSSTSATKKRNLEEWERHAKLLPHVPHINYNRVLGRWYARVRDPNTGKRLWKGYTCSIHGFLKARQMAVERLSMHENDFIQKMNRKKQMDSNAEHVDKHPDNSYGSFNEDFNSKFNEDLDHFSSLIGLERNLSTDFEGIRNSDGADKERVRSDNVKIEYLENGHSSRLEDLEKNKRVVQSGDSYKTSSCRSDYEELAKKLNIFPGVFFEPQSLSWIAFYLNKKDSKSTQRSYDDIRIIAKYKVDEYGFLEARSEAIKARSHWEQEANLSINLMNNFQGNCLYGDQGRLIKNQSKYLYQDDVNKFASSCQGGRFYGYNINSENESSEKCLRNQFCQNDEVLSVSVSSRGRKVKSDRHQYMAQEKHEEEVETSFKATNKSYDKDMDFYEPRKPNKKRRKLPSDFVCVRHDQWGKGWRCVWADQNGFQRSKFYGESKWGRENCKRKAEELMEQIKSEHHKLKELL